MLNNPAEELYAASIQSSLHDFEPDHIVKTAWLPSGRSPLEHFTQVALDHYPVADGWHSHSVEFIRVEFPPQSIA